ncbi:MAG: hypothetical protein JXB34_11435 [Bacteroidales bacterium]|nr:hypothetical protein [Bacteroidales bacterium]
MYASVAHIVLLSLLLNGGTTFFSENYIGKDKIYIEQHIKENHKTLKLNTTSTNTTYNYLKFEDRINEITVLFFLSDKNKCTLVRLMSDYSNINDMLYELDQAYTKTDKNSWKFADKGTGYSVKLDEGDWFFTITIREESSTY